MGRGPKGKWFGNYRSVLARRDVRRLFGALVVSATGSWAYNVALLAFVYQRTHSLRWVGLAGLCRFGSALLASAYGGVIAERTERVRVMLCSDLLNTVWQSLLAVVIFARGPVLLALVFATLTSVTSVVYSPAVAATLPSVVSEDDLVAANALNGTIDNLVVIMGPAVGALLLLIGPPSVVVAVNAGSFALSALIVSSIRVRSHPVDVTESGTVGPLRQMLVGVKTIVTLRAARALVAFSVLASFIYGTDTVLFVGVSQDRIGTGAEGFGYLLVGLGVGGVLMAPAVDRLSRLPRLGPLIVGGLALYCLPTAMLAYTHSAVLAVGIQVIRGAATLVVDVLAITALQRAVPADQLARVFGVFFAFVLGAISIGVVVTPIVANHFGLNDALWAAALAPFALGLFGYLPLHRIDEDTHARTVALAPRVATLENLGIFTAASRAVLEALAAAATEIEFQPATAIVTEGEPSDALYVLVSGEVEVSASGEAGPSLVIRTMTAPSYFGEIGVLEHIPRTATVRAVTLCRCDRISGDSLRNALQTSPPSSSLMENHRSRLALTHPSKKATFGEPTSA